MNRIVVLIFALLFGFIVGFLVSTGLSDSGKYSNLISAIVGAAVALAIPIWHTYVVQKSKLTLEVNGINRKVSDKVKISFDEYSELSYLKKLRQDDLPSFIFSDGLPKRPYQDKSISIEELTELLDRSKQDLKDFPEKLSDRKNDLEKINSFTPETFTKYECNKLNRRLDPEIDYDDGEVNKTLEEFKKHYQERFADVKEKYEELQSSLPEIERKVAQIKSELIENNSFFEMSVTLINSGRLNTSIKKPALFRVYIGKENYIDLKLTLNDFENKSEISPNSTVVGTFSSTDISQLPEEDRKLINTYWGQSVQCHLFVEDVHGMAGSSNSIAFSEGLYQKIIFDRLAVVATNQNM